MKNLQIVFAPCKEWLTSLKKKIMGELINPTDYSIIKRLFNGEKIEIKYNNHYRKVLRIEFSEKKPYVIIDDGENTQVFFNEIKDFKLTK
jgi:hypothetical protein